ncbi:unnamed protein product, partial [Prorocentrum cordatum]
MPTHAPAPEPTLEEVNRAAQGDFSPNTRKKAKRVLGRLDGMGGEVDEGVLCAYMFLRRLGKHRPRADEIAQWDQKRRKTVEASKMGKTVWVVKKSMAPHLQEALPLKVFVDPRTVSKLPRGTDPGDIFLIDQCVPRSRLVDSDGEPLAGVLEFEVSYAEFQQPEDHQRSATLDNSERPEDQSQQVPQGPDPKRQKVPEGPNPKAGEKDSGAPPGARPPEMASAIAAKRSLLGAADDAAAAQEDSVVFEEIAKSTARAAEANRWFSPGPFDSSAFEFWLLQFLRYLQDMPAEAVIPAAAAQHLKFVTREIIERPMVTEGTLKRLSPVLKQIRDAAPIADMAAPPPPPPAGAAPTASTLAPPTGSFLQRLEGQTGEDGAAAPPPASPRTPDAANGPAAARPESAEKGDPPAAQPAVPFGTMARSACGGLQLTGFNMQERHSFLECPLYKDFVKHRWTERFRQVREETRVPKDERLSNFRGLLEAKTRGGEADVQELQCMDTLMGPGSLSMKVEYLVEKPGRFEIAKAWRPDDPRLCLLPLTKPGPVALSAKDFVVAVKLLGEGPASLNWIKNGHAKSLVADWRRVKDAHKTKEEHQFLCTAFFKELVEAR